jgi:hypothetical protein
MVYAASPAAVGQLLRDAHRLGQLRPQVGRSVDGTAADGDAVYIRRDG